MKMSYIMHLQHVAVSTLTSSVIVSRLKYKFCQCNPFCKQAISRGARATCVSGSRVSAQSIIIRIKIIIIILYTVHTNLNWVMGMKRSPLTGL